MTSRDGPDKSRRMPRCRTCEVRSSERKGTPLLGARLSPEKVESVPEHVAEGRGVRQAGLPCRVAPSTVARSGRPAGTPGTPTTTSWRFPPHDRGPVR